MDIVPAFHIVAHEITNDNLFLATRQVRMRQKIHKNRDTLRNVHLIQSVKINAILMFIRTY